MILSMTVDQIVSSALSVDELENLIHAAQQRINVVRSTPLTHEEVSLLDSSKDFSQTVKVVKLIRDRTRFSLADCKMIVENYRKTSK